MSLALGVFGCAEDGASQETTRAQAALDEAVGVAVDVGGEAAASDELDGAGSNPRSDGRHVGPLPLSTGEGGISSEVTVQVPPRTRSITVLVRGSSDSLYALSSLVTADGIERIGEAVIAGGGGDGASVGERLRDVYFTERIGRLPGGATQTARIGVFTLVYPSRPGDPLPTGPTTFRVVASDPRAAPATVEVFLPEEDGAHTLTLRVLGGEPAQEGQMTAASSSFVEPLSRILESAGIRVEVLEHRRWPLGIGRVMTVANAPQEGPSSESARLVARYLASRGQQEGAPVLNVFLADALPAGVAGWSLGTPSPPVDDTYYSGIIVDRRFDGDELGRVIAHEVAHALGLYHLEDRSSAGTLYTDPLDDTAPGTGNLMERGGRHITAQQAAIMRRSALLH